jgi:hypothetical protein
MNAYAIFGARDAAELDTRIPRAFSNSLKIGAGQWIVVHASVLPNEVYTALKAGGSDIFCVIVGIRSYYGWQDKAVWDWIENAVRAQ